jgi:hypothetical protein
MPATLRTSADPGPLPSGALVAPHFDCFALLYRGALGGGRPIKDGLGEPLPGGPGAKLRLGLLRSVLGTALYREVAGRTAGRADLAFLGATVLLGAGLKRLHESGHERWPTADSEGADDRSAATESSASEDAAPSQNESLDGAGESDEAKDSRDEAKASPAPDDESEEPSTGTQEEDAVSGEEPSRTPVFGGSASDDAHDEPPPREMIRALQGLSETAAASGALARMGFGLGPAALERLRRRPYLLSRVAEACREVLPLFGRAEGGLAGTALGEAVSSGSAQGGELAFGHHLQRALPQELALLASGVPVLEDLFLARLACGTLLQWDEAPEGKADGRGDVLVLVDESASMRGAKAHQAKALAAAVRFHAERQGRKATLCSFAAREEDLLVVEPSASPADAMDWLTRFLGGGTDYGPPLRWALQRLARPGGERADVLLLSDGAFRCSKGLAREVQAAVESRGARVWAVRFGDGPLGALAEVATHVSRAQFDGGRFQLDGFAEA